MPSRLFTPPAPPADPQDIDTIIARLFLASAEAYAARIAVEDEFESVTYRDLELAMIRIARLIERAVEPGDPVGILLPMAASNIAARLAALATGRPFVPMDPDAPPSRNRRIVSHSGMSAALVDPAHAAIMRAIAPELRQIAVPPAGLSDGSAVSFSVTATPEDIAFISYTSGSTGQPKGVFHNQRGVLHEILQAIPRHHFTPEDRIAFVSGPGRAGSRSSIFGTLLAGARISIINVKRLGLHRARERIAAQKICYWHSVPALFRAVFDIEAGPPVPAELRWVGLGGDRLLPSDIALFKRRFSRGARLRYGMGATESGAAIAHWFIDHDTIIGPGLVPIGRPSPDRPIRLVDEAGQPVAMGETGEIILTGRSLALGYWRDEALTRARFSPSALVPGATEYRTGDLARFNGDGLLVYVGRKDRQVKVLGNTVNPGEIEAVLAGCPGVAAVAIIARRQTAEVVLVAYCAAAPGAALTEADLRRWSRDHLTVPMRPTHFFLLPALPVLPNGKLDFVTLAAEDQARATALPEPQAALASAESELSTVVRQAWIGVLDAPSFEADREFDAAGGDSLKALEFLLRLERALDRALPASLLTPPYRPSDIITRLSARAPLAARRDLPVLHMFCGATRRDLDFERLAEGMADLVSPRVIAYGFDGDPIESLLADVAPGPDGLVHLLGCSLGGKLVAELAWRLAARGSRIGFVGILDAPAPGGHDNLRRAGISPAAHQLRGIAIGLAAWRATPRSVAASAVARLGGRLGLRTCPPILLAALRRVGLAKQARTLESRFIGAAISRRFAGLPPRRLDRAWLFRTNHPDSMRPLLRHDLGWGDWVAQLEIIDIAGDHVTMLHPPHRDRVTALLRAAFTRCADQDATARPAVTAA